MTFGSKRRVLAPPAFVASAFVLLAYAVPGCGGDDSSERPTVEAGSVGDANPSDSEPATDGSADGAPVSDGGDAGDASDAADAADAATPNPLSASYVDFEINHVLLAGQSNSVGNGGKPPMTLTQPYTNLMFDTGTMPMSNCDQEGCKDSGYQTPTEFKPLVEGDYYFDPTYTVETPANGIADEISKLALGKYQFNVHAGYPTKHDVLVSLHGRSGNTYWCLRKGGCNYKPAYNVSFAQGLADVTKAKALAGAKSYVVRAVMSVHGESDQDGYVSNGHDEFPLDGTDGVAGKITSYKDALLEWQSDYEAGINAITGQTQPVPLFISGVSGWGPNKPAAKHAASSVVAQYQLDAHIAAPGKVVYVAPGYQFSVTSDCIHYDGPSERKLGEQFAKVYSKVVFGGETWEPVRPKMISRAGAVVTVQYFVPKPPLVFDTTHVTAPTDGKMGFTFIDNGTKVAISSVAIMGADTVVITLAAAPSGTNMRLRYAQNQPIPGDADYTATTCIGNGIAFPGGARGNLRDSDDTPSQYGNDLWNWGVNLDVVVP